MTTPSFLLKPGQDLNTVRARLAALREDLAAAVLKDPEKAHAAQVVNGVGAVVENVFLDPSVAAEIRHATLGENEVTAARIDNLLQMAARQLQTAPDEEVSDWPKNIRGGERLLRFRIVRSLGEGGMGSVVLAWDEDLDRHVVLKRPHPEQQNDEGLARFLREGRSAARVRSEFAAVVYGIAHLRNVPILVQEYIDGQDLEELLGTLPPAALIRVAAHVATGVAAAHAAGILHRDLKPTNVRVRPTGEAVVIDFGLGKAFTATAEETTQLALTASGMIVGTPYYLAPELLKGSGANAPADVFSFGVLLYELITGLRPFTASTRMALFAAILRDTQAAILRTDIPQELIALVDECLAKNPGDRPTMEEIVSRLQGLRETRAIGAVRPSQTLDLDIVHVVPSAWGAAQRERGRVGISTTTVTFEVEFRPSQPIPPIAMSDLRHGLNSLSTIASIGHINIDDRHKPRREADDIYAFPASDCFTYWAASRRGDFFYLTDVPLLARNAVSIETLLGETIRSVRYLAQYASTVTGDLPVVFTIIIHNVGGHLLAATNWTDRFTTSLDARLKRAEQDVATSAATSARALRDSEREVVMTVFDDLMTYFDFLEGPSTFYAKAFETA